MYFSFASKDKGSCNVSTCKFIRFPLNSYTFHALIRFFTPQFSKKRTIFHLSILICHWSKLRLCISLPRKLSISTKDYKRMKKHLIAWGILSTMFMANTFAQKDIDRPIMGWSSWNTYHVNISEELIKQQADALIKHGLKEAGYNYINIDDGFFGHRDETGKMHPHPDRFPNGMKVVSDYIHSLGLKAGIYSDAGDNTCGSIYDNDANGVGSGLYGHEQQDMDLYLKEWNYDFIKIDYCGGRELGLDEEKRYSTICQAIANTGRTDVSINICRWAFPGTWAKRLARSWRISPDIRPRWNSVKGIIEKNLYLSAYATDGHYNDMDMLEIGRGLKPNEEEVHFGMWCIMSSPLLIGCDMNTIPDFSLKLLKNKELIALNQDVLGLQAHVVQHENESYVLVKDIERKRGLTRAVALYNPSDQPCDFIVPFETLELGGNVKVRDLIKQKDLGKMKEEIRQTVQSHSVMICKMEAEKRLEPVSYEAEWAYLPCYDDLGKKSKPIVYVPASDCSGRMKISRLGGREENFAEWSEVYSEKGGNYEMTIFYSCDKNRKLEVSVNGTKTVLKDLNSNNEVKSVTIPVSLKQGYNTVRMGNNFGWAPDIDRFTVSRQ